MIKRCAVWLSIVSVVLFAGCENKELVQCQQDSQALKNKFEAVQKSSGEMMSTLIKSSQADKNQIKSLEEQVAAANVNLLKSQQNEKKCQAKMSRLNNRIGEQEKRLAQVLTKNQEAQAFLQSILAENEKLKAQIKELQDQPQQAKDDEADTDATDQQKSEPRLIE